MTLTFDQGHDGEGYDLEALGRCGDDEKKHAARVLADKLLTGGGWRDIDALETLGFAIAWPPLLQAYLKHPDLEIRLRAGLILEDWKAPVSVDVESMIVDVIRESEAGRLTYMLHMAEARPTPKVRAALLERVRDGDSTTRVHCAAMLLYLAGKAKEPFDWAHRPFFLRFGEDGPDRDKAFEALKQRIGFK